MSFLPDDRGTELRTLFFESAAELLQSLNEAGLELERIRPELDHLLHDLPAVLQNIQLPIIRVDIDSQDAKPVRAVRPAAAPLRQTVSM